MSQTKTAVEHLRSPDRDLPPKVRSPSPPATETRAASLAPSSPKPTAARLLSPQPESRATPTRERTPAAPIPAPPPAAKETPAEPSDAPPEDEDVRVTFHSPLRTASTLTFSLPSPQIETENVIDLETFNQILDLDEDDTHDFSLGMAEAYFSQASTTFTDMEDALYVPLSHSVCTSPSISLPALDFAHATHLYLRPFPPSAAKDLPKLSSLGHFLKGSSAALGVSAVQATCEHIQHYGALRDETNGKDLTRADALAKIAPLLKRVKREYAIAERWLQQWYKEHVTPAEV